LGVAVVAASVAAELIHNQIVESSISEVVVGFATTVTIVVLVSWGEAGSGTAGVSMAGARSWGPRRAVGRASDSLYLVHPPTVAVSYLTVFDDQG
jgi:peptidoglycan/LPS O-acetylase OafA/YrhL